MTKRGNGEGTYTQIRDGRWEGRITIGATVDANGKTRLIRKKITAPTQKELIERMRSARIDADAGVTPVRRDLTIAAFLNDWLDSELPGNVSPATEAQYRQVVRLYVIPRIGRKKLRTLTADDVSKMLASMAKPNDEHPNGYSYTARRLARGVLRRAIRHAERQGLVMRNAAAIASGPRKPQTVGRTMTREEAVTFVESVRSHRLEAAFVVALGCGLRVSELGGLAWSDVKLTGSGPATITVRRGLKRVAGIGLLAEDLKTSRSRRTLHLPQPALDALKAHKVRQAAERLAMGDRWPQAPLGHDFVFRTVTGKPLDAGAFWRSLTAATQEAGLGHWHPHELRHSAASLMFASNVPLKVVSETLGHSGITITADIYSHLLGESRQQAADAMTHALGGAS